MMRINLLFSDEKAIILIMWWKEKFDMNNVAAGREFIEACMMWEIFPSSQ
jgi:hypothetical protein